MNIKAKLTEALEKLNTTGAVKGRSITNEYKDVLKLRKQFFKKKRAKKN